MPARGLRGVLLCIKKVLPPIRPRLWGGGADKTFGTGQCNFWAVAACQSAVIFGQWPPAKVPIAVPKVFISGRFLSGKAMPEGTGPMVLAFFVVSMENMNGISVFGVFVCDRGKPLFSQGFGSTEMGVPARNRKFNRFNMNFI